MPEDVLGNFKQTIGTEIQRFQQLQKDLAKQQNDFEVKVIEEKKLLLRQQISYSTHTFLSRNSTIYGCFNSVSVTSLRQAEKCTKLDHAEDKKLASLADSWTFAAWIRWDGRRERKGDK